MFPDALQSIQALKLVIFASFWLEVTVALVFTCTTVVYMITDRVRGNAVAVVALEFVAEACLACGKILVGIVAAIVVT